MFDEGLKTSLWVSAEIRRCDGIFLPMTVMHRGDGDRGFVMIKQYIAGQGCIIHSRKRDMSGKLVWHCPLGDTPVPERDGDDYITRQRGYDEDLWVLEVDDPKGLYAPLS
ncbi:hypothetical protein MNBD_ALPHA02-1162 [hydrothermal vent metagenome]|uniref:DUF1491 family protein n=1 Tax=hydrothermal vent metagenome TaxID=652676 RepID=A0A3B0R383_9ZZZZ